MLILPICAYVTKIHDHFNNVLVDQVAEFFSKKANVDIYICESISSVNDFSFLKI